MSASLGSAVLDLTTDPSGLEEGMGQAEQTTQSRMGRIGGIVGKGAKVAGAALVGAGAAAVTGAFKTAQYGDELDKTSTKLGVHTDFLQDAQHWASQNGISAQSMERGVGRLNQRIGRAIDGNEKYADAFRDVGVELKDQQGNVRDTDEVMRDTIDSLQGIEDPAQRSAAASEIFGTKMARDLMPALEDGSLSLEEATAAMDEHGRMTEDQIEQSAEFSDAWDNIKTAGMSVLRDMFTPVMGFMSDRMFPFIQEKIVPALQAFGEWLGPKLAAAGEWVGRMWEEHVEPALAALAQWWEEHGPAIIARAQELWSGIREGAQRLADWWQDNVVPLIQTLRDWWEEHGPAIIGRAESLGSSVIAVFEAIGDAIDTVIGWFQDASSSADSESSFIGDTFGQLADIALSAWDAISAAVEVAMNIIESVVSAVTAAVQYIWTNWGEQLMSAAESIWEMIKGVISGVLDVIHGIFETFAGLFTGDWSRMWEGIKTIFSGIWDALVALFTGLWDTFQSLIEMGQDMIRSLWESLWDWVLGKAESIWDSITDAVSTGVDNTLQFFRDLPGNIMDALGDLGSLLLDAGRNIMQGLIDGIRNMLGNVRDAASDAASAVRDALPFSPAKYGPLRDHPPDEAGESIAEMLAGGLEGGVGDVQASMSHLVGPGSLAIGGAGDGTGQAMTEHYLKRIDKRLAEQAREPLVTALNRSERLAS